MLVDGQAEIASGLLASAEYFDAIGVGPSAGRAIGPADDRDASPVAMLSHRYWERRFGGDPNVVGRVITINSVPVTIVGVLPPEYAGVQRLPEPPADIHLPLALHPQLRSDGRLGDPTFWWLQVMGRLGPGVSPAQVRGNLEGAFRSAARAGIETYLEEPPADERALPRNRDRSAVPRLLVESARRGLYDASPNATRQALILGVAVKLILLIVCANVANLLLSRYAARHRELAARLRRGLVLTDSSSCGL